MALTVDQTYVTLAELRSYADLRGLVLPADDQATEALMIAAMDYLETLVYWGSKTDEDQVLQWPRSGVYINCVEIDEDVVPVAIKSAQMALSVAANTITLFPNAAANAKGAKIQETVPGAVSVTYASPEKGKSKMPYLPQVAALLRDYVKSGFGGIGNIFAVRA
jgi:hypothetical protein